MHYGSQHNTGRAELVLRVRIKAKPAVFQGCLLNYIQDVLPSLKMCLLFETVSTWKALHHSNTGAKKQAEINCFRIEGVWMLMREKV